MELSELYQEIQGEYSGLNAMMREYIKNALKENGGEITLKYKSQDEYKNGDYGEYEEQFPICITVWRRYGYIDLHVTSVFMAGGRDTILYKGIDTVYGDEDEDCVEYYDLMKICDFIDYCLKQRENENSRKEYETYLNNMSPDRDSEEWIIGGKNRYCGRENYGTMMKRYDPIGFNVGYREWVEQPQ